MLCEPTDMIDVVYGDFSKSSQQTGLRTRHIGLYIMQYIESYWATKVKHVNTEQGKCDNTD